MAMAKGAALISESRLVQGETVGFQGGIDQRIDDITNPKGTSELSRAYRGELGAERQASAQKQLHDLYNARGKAA